MLRLDTNKYNLNHSVAIDLQPDVRFKLLQHDSNFMVPLTRADPVIHRSRAAGGQ